MISVPVWLLVAMFATITAFNTLNVLQARKLRDDAFRVGDHSKTNADTASALLRSIDRIAAIINRQRGGAPAPAEIVRGLGALGDSCPHCQQRDGWHMPKCPRALEQVRS